MVPFLVGLIAEPAFVAALEAAFGRNEPAVQDRRGEEREYARY